MRFYQGGSNMKKPMILFAVISMPLSLSIFAGAQGRGSVPAVNSHAQVGTHSAVAVQGHDKADAGTATEAKTRGAAQSSAKGDSDFATRIASDSKLSARLQGMLPANMTIQDAAAGFKNEGQFIAALHVSQNLQIPFDQLKNKMTGTEALSLGSAIHKLRPDISQAQANDEAKKAEKTAKETEKANQN
jgi:hypothetical protein